MSDAFARDLSDRLVAVTRWREIEHREVVTSTNTILVERARRGSPAGAVLIADRQTAGRGRGGHRWEDRPGGSVAVSVLVDDRAPRPTLVPLAAGLAVRQVALTLGASPELKWPNDVLLAGRKTAGILVERVSEAGQLVIGIGLNLDWRGTERTGEAASWTSFAEATGTDVDRREAVVDLLAALDRWLTVTERDPGRLVHDYRDVCVTLGAEVQVELPDGITVGVAEDVTPEGALLLRTGERQLRLDAGSVRHVRRA
jgi:BirA family transcriptional regulator, biotin operon repressor / biotin---[acetyl-CoA-carboxylase] ligase